MVLNLELQPICISVVRAFGDGAMGRRIDPSWKTHLAIYRSSHWSTTGLKYRDMHYHVCRMMYRVIQ